MGLRLQTVLLVDDDPELCDLLSHLLGEAGYQVTVASDLRTLKPLLSKCKPAVAVVDLMLPEQGGLVACQVIREAVGREVPLLLKAPQIEEVDRADVKFLGADDFLMMPFMVEEVVERVQRLCCSER